MLQDQSNDFPDGAVETRPQHWADLGLMEKLDSLHLLIDWQFQNVTRFRRTVKSDGENAEWVCYNSIMSKLVMSCCSANGAHWI
jgi:hypothetical protein